ncbi:MAG: electron transfer flavoprotein subunit alpha/FixB family protein [Ilumatobacter sp.]|uniref:electron transfer flavoprotein subunit alpha/FixB family protein n=1 Tax=Ilumatobacter sp. TaxID=1967498 RepID=UPI003C7657CE
MSVLVVVEHDRGQMADATLEAFAFAGSIASQLGVNVEALLIGADAGALAELCAAHGAGTVHHAADAALTDYGPDAYGAVVATAANELSPSAIVASGSDRGNEVLAFAAADLDLPFVANCLDVKTADEWEMTRVQWGGSLNEDARLASSMPILSSAPHAIEAAEPVSGASATVQVLDVSLPEAAVATIIQDRIVLSEGVTLATAPVVIGGGRGVGSAEGFEVLEALAAKLGGVVGCSRAVTNNGWRPHSDQVGQTGTRIAPQLYIACGISGAIQHWVGAKAAKKILAVNTDPAANMVVKADYAIIGDLFEVLPAITDS